jgi:hypothetical protein
MQRVLTCCVMRTGQALKPSKEHAARAKSVNHKLQETLCCTGQKYGGCSVDRVRMSGSRGRSTSLVNSDVDFVLMLNKACPPWDGALEDVACRLARQLRVDATVARCAHMHVHTCTCTSENVTPPCLCCTARIPCTSRRCWASAATGWWPST